MSVPLQAPAVSPKRIGFISTRFHGTDGVSLEAAKWAHIFREDGHQCFWFGGLLDTPPEISRLAPLAFFNHPQITALQGKLYGVSTRSRAVTNEIQEIKERLKDELYAFIAQFQLDVLVPQNVLAIPMHIPLGLAVTEVLAETGLACIAHHHDFTWERERFTMNGVGDYLQAAFPPVLPRLQHVVINSLGQKELARRFGLPSIVVPNILDYDTPPPVIDDYNRDLRAEIGLSADDIFILQPTRVVARKGIEHAIELVRRLREPRAKLVISHPAGDEGNEYLQLLQDRIADAGIDVRFIAERVGEARGVDANGRKIYTLFDVYLHADLVTYPSTYEGFGNAFLEAIYFHKPVLVNLYSVYARDIAPLGFKTISMSQLVTEEVLAETREILRNAELRAEWGRINFELGRKYFSYGVARRKLNSRLANLFGEGEGE